MVSLQTLRCADVGAEQKLNLHPVLRRPPSGQLTAVFQPAVLLWLPLDRRHECSTERGKQHIPVKFHHSVKNIKVSGVLSRLVRCQETNSTDDMTLAETL